MEDDADLGGRKVKQKDGPPWGGEFTISIYDTPLRKFFVIFSTSNKLFFCGDRGHPTSR
jgi:hypothetical protein